MRFQGWGRKVGDTVEQEARMAGAPREARLMSKYARFYTGLPAGVWLPAGEVAEHIVAVVRGEGGRPGLQGRVLADDHFEFRGGEPSPATRARSERREDRPSAV